MADNNVWLTDMRDKRRELPKPKKKPGATKSALK